MYTVTFYDLGKSLNAVLCTAHMRELYHELAYTSVVSVNDGVCEACESERAQDASERRAEAHNEMVAHFGNPNY